MNVLILASSDWAGVGNSLTESLCKVGINAKFYSVKKGIYRHTNKTISKKQAKEFSNKCDIIQYMHSVKVPLDINLKNKKVLVFHGGSKYRGDYKNICKIFNPIVDCSLIQTYDLFNLGAKNEIWLLPPVNTELIKPVYKTKKDHIIIGHFPSSSKGKGSKNIQKIINSIKNEVPYFEYIYSDRRIPWNQQLKRMSQVDIYIERMNMEKETKNGIMKTGVWGITALEAAALGKVVVTNFLGREKYLEEYGECYLQTANSKQEMKTLLINLLSKSKSELFPLKKDTRKWVEKHHSFDSVGLRLRRIYESL